MNVYVCFFFFDHACLHCRQNGTGSKFSRIRIRFPRKCDTNEFSHRSFVNLSCQSGSQDHVYIYKEKKIKFNVVGKTVSVGQTLLFYACGTTVSHEYARTDVYIIGVVDKGHTFSCDPLCFWTLGRFNRAQYGKTAGFSRWLNETSSDTQTVVTIRRCTGVRECVKIFSDPAGTHGVINNLPPA